MVRCGRTDLSKATQDLVLQQIHCLITGWLGISSILMSDCVSAVAHRPAYVSDSNVAASQKVEGPVLAAVGCLKLVPQTELPLVLQFQPDDGLT